MTASLLRKLDRARRFPVNTCAASSLVEIVGRDLLKRGRSWMIEDEPEEVAEAMLATVLALRRLRNKVAA